MKGCLGGGERSCGECELASVRRRGDFVIVKMGFDGLGSGYGEKCGRKKCAFEEYLYAEEVCAVDTEFGSSMVEMLKNRDTQYCCIIVVRWCYCLGSCGRCLVLAARGCSSWDLGTIKNRPVETAQCFG